MDYKEKTRHILNIISRRSTIPTARKQVDPRFYGIEHLPNEVLFSEFNPQHAKLAARIVQILLGKF